MRKDARLTFRADMVSSPIQLQTMLGVESRSCRTIRRHLLQRNRTAREFGVTAD